MTGYGEDIIQNAFQVDFGLVETVAHFTAAKAFMPDVEFIIDNFTWKSPPNPLPWYRLFPPGTV